MTDLEEIRNEVLRQMYSEAEPGIDFDHALENPDEYEDGWYDEHYLDSERQKKIVEHAKEKYDLSDRESLNLTMSTILNLGPRGHKRDEEAE